MRFAFPLQALTAVALLGACSTPQRPPSAAVAAPASEAKPAPAAAVAAAAPATPAGGKQAKMCALCHAAPAAGTIRGHFDEVAFKAKSFQMKVDADTDVLTFEPATLKIVNAPEGADLEKVLKAIRKGMESRVDYVVEGGQKKVTTLTLKPKLKVAEEKQVKTAELEKLVSQGPEKGKYVLFDARPFPKFAEGHLPTAQSLPFPAFDKEKGKLPADKATLVIFYCAGVTCALSPAARDAAEKLGYTNAKIYHEGTPVWSKANPMALEPKLLKEAWMDKDQPIVVLDARKDTAGGVIAGAAGVADGSAAALGKVTKLKKLKPPVVVYDADGAGKSVEVAKALVAAGQPAMVLTGGLAAWKGAGYPLAAGAPTTEVAFTPKPKAGELSVEAFKQLVAATPPNVLLLDVRNADELADGAFKGSVNIPATQLSSRTAELPKDKKIVTHCSTGVRAEMAYNMLKGAGFADVAFLNSSVDFFGGKAEIGGE
jgi:rhodanese-related sulfurtransferase